MSPSVNLPPGVSTAVGQLRPDRRPPLAVELGEVVRRRVRERLGLVGEDADDLGNASGASYVVLPVGMLEQLRVNLAVEGEMPV